MKTFIIPSLVLLSLLSITSATGITGLIDLADLACLMYGWSGMCKNFVQGAAIGIGGNLRNLYRAANPGSVNETYATINAFQCMMADEQACASTVTQDKLECAWCDHPKDYVEKWGKGSCMLKPLKDVGCALMSTTMLKPLEATGLDIPNGPGQAQCLQHNASPEECNQEHGGYTCQYCDMPDVYGWRPSTGICLQKNILGNPGDKLGCDALNDIPSGAKNILA